MQGRRPAIIVGANRMGKTVAAARMVEAAREAGHPVVIASFDQLKDLEAGLTPAEFRKEYIAEFEPEAPPPRRLSIKTTDPDFHPSYVRVGVRVDGVERNDIAYYNLDDLSYKTERNTSHLATSIEPYWRFSESRQQRRARERWEQRRTS